MWRSLSSTCFHDLPPSSDKKMPPPSPCIPVAFAHAARYRRFGDLGSTARPLGPLVPSGRVTRCQCSAPSVDLYSAPSPALPMLPSSERRAITTYRVPSDARARRHANGWDCVIPWFLSAQVLPSSVLL